MKNVNIILPKRTFLSGLSGLSATELGKIIIENILKNNGGGGASAEKL